MSRNPSPKIDGLSRNLIDLLDTLNNGPDMAVVLVGTGFIDACLRAILESHLKKSKVSTKILDSQRGSIGTFSAKSDLCYCLGIIEKNIYQELGAIGAIRNEFAHNHLQLNFSSEKVASLCNELKYASTVPHADGNKLAFDNRILKDVRSRVVITIVLISHHLIGIGWSKEDADAV